MSGSANHQSMYVAIFGKMRVGKSELARSVKEHLHRLLPGLPISIVSISSPIKRVAAEILGLTEEEIRNKPPKVRRFLQRFGDILREYDQNILLRAALKGQQGIVIIDDCRLKSEFEYFRSQSAAVLVSVTREPHPDGDSATVQPMNQNQCHRTETDLDTLAPEEFDILVSNDGSFERYRDGDAFEVAEEIAVAATERLANFLGRI